MLCLIGLAPLAFSKLSLYRSPSGPPAQTWAAAHAPHFRDLDALGFPPDGLWTERQYAREITCELSTVYTVWDEQGDGSLLAFACCERVLDETHMLSLTVHPAWRGCGLARTLVLVSLWAAKAAGQRLLTLEVRTSNTPAFELYTSCGMRYIGKRRRYYRSPPEDALLLTTQFDGESLPLHAGDEMDEYDEEQRLEALIGASDAEAIIRKAASNETSGASGAAADVEHGQYGELIGELSVSLKPTVALEDLR